MSPSFFIPFSIVHVKTMRDETIRGGGHRFGSSQSDESGLDMERNTYGQPNGLNLRSSPLSLQAFASSGQHSESNAAYFSWPTSTRLNDAAEGRANFFGNLQKGVLPRNLDRLPRGQQASTLLDLMTIRAFHSKILRCYSLGTAIGFRIRKGVLTNIPAILVFVARKVHKKWLSIIQCLPSALEVKKYVCLLIWLGTYTSSFFHCTLGYLLNLSVCNIAFTFFLM